MAWLQTCGGQAWTSLRSNGRCAPAPCPLRIGGWRIGDSHWSACLSLLITLHDESHHDEDGIIFVHIARIRHERIGGDEGAQVGVVVPGVEIVQPGGVAILLPGEAVIGRQGAAVAQFAIGVVALVGNRRAAIVRGVDHAAQRVLVEVFQRVGMPAHRYLQPAKGVILGAAAHAIDHRHFIVGEEIVDDAEGGHRLDPLAVRAVAVGGVSAGAAHSDQPVLVIPGQRLRAVE
jgi:hypothetical protein